MDRTERENAEYQKKLESLVTARTEQLRQAVTQIEELLKFLKQLQSMRSLDQVHDAVQSAIKKFESASQ